MRRASSPVRSCDPTAACPCPGDWALVGGIPMADFPQIISVDDHVVDPANVWQDRLPAKYRDIGPRVQRARVAEMTFVGGVFTAVPAEAGTEGFDVDWWYYENLRRPL